MLFYGKNIGIKLQTLLASNKNTQSSLFHRCVVYYSKQRLRIHVEHLAKMHPLKENVQWSFCRDVKFLLSKCLWFLFQDERRRIEDLGGVLVYAGTWRVNGILGVSRAIGQYYSFPQKKKSDSITQLKQNSHLEECCTCFGCDTKTGVVRILVSLVSFSR